MAVVTGNASINTGFNQVVSSGLISSQTYSAAVSLSTQFTNGTGANQVDLFYAKQLSLAAAATTLDLTSLTDVSGSSVNFARVRILIIQVVTTTAGFTVAVSQGAANGWSSFINSTGVITLSPGCTHCLVYDAATVGGSNGYFTGGTNKTIKLDPSANTVSVNVEIVGCSATS